MRRQRRSRTATCVGVTKFQERGSEAGSGYLHSRKDADQPRATNSRSSSLSRKSCGMNVRPETIGSRIITPPPESCMCQAKAGSGSLGSHAANSPSAGFPQKSTRSPFRTSSPDRYRKTRGYTRQPPSFKRPHSKAQTWEPPSSQSSGPMSVEIDTPRTPAWTELLCAIAGRA